MTFKIKNNGNFSFRYVKVKVNLEDDNDNILTSEWTYAVDSLTLDPNESREFDIMIKKPSSGSVPHYSWRVIEFD